MKIISKSIDMVAWFNVKGEPNPIKFRIEKEDESFSVIKIDKVLLRKTEKFAGNIMYIFQCKSIINDEEKMYEIKYELSTCKWILWKI